MNVVLGRDDECYAVNQLDPAKLAKLVDDKGAQCFNRLTREDMQSLTQPRGLVSDNVVYSFAQLAVQNKNNPRPVMVISPAVIELIRTQGNVFKIQNPITD
jgi:hypothetical protein